MALSRKGLTVVVLASAVVGMVGLSFAAVPLYQLFCQVTGYGGTTQLAEAAPAVVAERTITVRFNADTGPDLPWRFQPVQREMTVHLGESAIAYFVDENTSSRPVLGSATFNVTPQKVGIYFKKIDCFCFTEQFLGAGERAELPVTFFVDPAILDDRNTREVTAITLSYTFFDQGDDGLDAYLSGGQQLAGREASGGAN